MMMEVCETARASRREMSVSSAGGDKAFESTHFFPAFPGYTKSLPRITSQGPFARILAKSSAEFQSKTSKEIDPANETFAAAASMLTLAPSKTLGLPSVAQTCAPSLARAMATSPVPAPNSKTFLPVHPSVPLLRMT
eukprot:Skav220275  [mRNA]  locus=scaffold3532:109072:109722:+ [translate_table: standard]